MAALLHRLAHLFSLALLRHTPAYAIQFVEVVGCGRVVAVELAAIVVLGQVHHLAEQTAEEGDFVVDAADDSDELGLQQNLVEHVGSEVEEGDFGRTVVPMVTHGRVCLQLSKPVILVEELVL